MSCDRYIDQHARTALQCSPDDEHMTHHRHCEYINHTTSAHVCSNTTHGEAQCKYCADCSVPHAVRRGRRAVESKPIVAAGVQLGCAGLSVSRVRAWLESEHEPTERGPTERGPPERGPPERGPPEHRPSERGPSEREPHGRAHDRSTSQAPASKVPEREVLTSGAPARGTPVWMVPVKKALASVVPASAVPLWTARSSAGSPANGARTCQQRRRGRVADHWPRICSHRARARCYAHAPRVWLRGWRPQRTRIGSVCSFLREQAQRS